jgi:NAD(P)-dependent dehydrogenase (short-subunit alcohol dehydrogenase family)
MTSTSAPVILVLGAGPGLGMSVAHRFGKQGYAVALISRSADRHADYLSSLADAGVDAAAFTGDAMEPHSLRHAVEAARARFGRIDVGYYGPADFGSLFGDITTLATLNPDDLAETVWQLYTERTEAEAVINALAA